MYYVFEFLGKYTIGIPSDIEGVKLYKYFNALSVKRKIYKLLLAFLIEAKLYKLVVNKKTTPVPMFPNFPFNEWLGRVEKKLGKGKLNPVVTFPSQIARKRFYVHLIDLDGECVGFSKISLTDENDYYLNNEAINISRIKSKISFKIPKILINETFDSHKYLVFEPLPKDSKFKSFQWESYPLQCSEEISKNTQSTKELESLSWWTSFETTMGREAIDHFINKLEIEKEFLTEIALAHGDLHSGNMTMANGEIWLFDWESSSSDAPTMTDELVFFLAQNQRKLVSNPDYVASKLRDYFLYEDCRTQRIKVGLALAYLSTTGRKDAKDMINKWDIIDGSE